MDQNLVILEGTVDNEPVIRDTPRSRVMNFRIGTKLDWQKYPDRHNVVVWGDKILRVEQGDRVSVKGRLQTRSYEKDGEKKWVTEVVADEIQKIAADKEDLPF